MAMKWSLVVAVFVLVVAVTTMNTQVEGLTCGTVANSLGPCINYLKGTAPLTTGCCSGVKSLNAAAQTTADRQQACKCLKSLGSSAKINYGLAGSLPAKCGVNIPYKISPSTDCAKIK